MSQNPKPPLFRAREIVGFVLLVVVVCTGLAANAVITDLRNAEESFRQRAYAFEREVADRMASAESVLTSLVGLHHASDKLRDHEFKALSRELRQAYPHIRTVAQLSVIQNEERIAFEEDKRNSGFVQFRVTERRPDGTMMPAGARKTVLPVVSWEPFDPEFATMIGFDALSDPRLEKAVRRAIDNGQVVASDVIEIPYAGSGYFAFKAIYFGYDAPNTVESRRAQFRGAVALYLDGSSLFNSISHPFENVTVRLVDAANLGDQPNGLVYRGEQGPVTETTDLFRPFQIALPLITQGRTFLIEITARPALSEFRGRFVGLFVLLPALAGGFLILALANHRRARRQALEDEARRRETNKRFKDFADSASDWYWEMDEELRFSYFSERFSELSGVPKELLLGKTREETGIPGLDPAVFGRHLADLQAHRPFRHFSHPRKLADGREVWLSISAKPHFDADGNFKGYRGTGSDITERKKADEALRRSQLDLAKAQELAQIGSWRWGIENDELVDCSETYARIHGVAPDAIFELMMQQMDSVIHPDDRGRIEHAFKTFDGLAADYEIDYRIVRPDGEVRHVLELGETVYDENGCPVEHVGTVQDITNQKRREQELAEAKTTAESASRAKSEFLAGMSHELRTPLNAVVGFSEILKSETFGPDGTSDHLEHAEHIHSAGLHLLGLINDLLDLSKIESGKDELHEETIDIEPLVRSAVRMVSQRSDEAKIELTVDLQEGLQNLRADRRKVIQILVNLLSNAIKFTEAGGRVTLRCWCQEDNGIAFQVLDTGIGIAPEDIPKALSRFTQVDSSLNRKFEGTGLGLPLTQGLIEQHGGSLDLQSQVGVGTTLTVRFPASRTVELSPGASCIPLDGQVASCAVR